MNRPSHHSIILPGNGAGNGAPSEQLEQRASPTKTGSKEDTAAASSTCISSSTFSCDEDSTQHPTCCRRSRWRLAREVVRGGEKKAQAQTNHVSRERVRLASAFGRRESGGGGVRGSASPRSEPFRVCSLLSRSARLTPRSAPLRPRLVPLCAARAERSRTFFPHGLRAEVRRGSGLCP